MAVQASGVTINFRPDGVIEIYVSEYRYEWRAVKIGHGYEVIIITPLPNQQPTEPLDKH